MDSNNGKDAIRIYKRLNAGDYASASKEQFEEDKYFDPIDGFLIGVDRYEKTTVNGIDTIIIEYRTGQPVTPKGEDWRDVIHFVEYLIYYPDKAIAVHFEDVSGQNTDVMNAARQTLEVKK